MPRVFDTAGPGHPAEVRRPMMSGAAPTPRRQERRESGISAGSCWPSASSVRTATQPSASAWRNPARSAAPCPGWAPGESPCAGRLGDRRGVVRRAVIHDQDRQVAAAASTTRRCAAPPRSPGSAPGCARRRAVVSGHGTAARGAPRPARSRCRTRGSHDARGPRDEVLDLVAVEGVEVHHDGAATGKVEQVQPEPLVAHDDPVVDGGAVEQGHGGCRWRRGRPGPAALRPRSSWMPRRPPTVASVGPLTMRPGRCWIQAASSATLPPTPGSGGGRAGGVLRCGLRVAEQVQPMASFSTGRSCM